MQEKNENRYIFINNENGGLDKKRILVTYELEEFGKEYCIFYDNNEKEIKNLYVVSYDKDTDFKNLNTNLSEKELKYAHEFIETIKEVKN